MPNLLQLSQSYTNEDSINYKNAWLREQVESGFSELGNLAYDDQVEVAKLGNSIMQGGYLKTELIDALAMRVGDSNSNVYISKDGINVKDGNIVVRDSNNKSVITSDGLRVMYVFSSTGSREGWGELILEDNLFGKEFQEMSIIAYVPDDLNIIKATLYTESMPTYLEDDYYGNPDGYYHAREIKLLKVDDFSQGYVPSQGFMVKGFPIYPSKTDITSSTWGSKWSPSGDRIRNITTDVSDHLNIGRNVFVIRSDLEPTDYNARYSSLGRMELIVEGFLRG